MVATWFDLSPRTTPPFQMTNTANVATSEMYGQSRVMRRMGLTSAEMTRLRRARMGSDSVSLAGSAERWHTKGSGGSKWWVV